MNRKRIIAVIGKGDVHEDHPAFNAAYHTGRSIIDNDMRLLTGGLGGVMEAASKGARSSPNWKDGDIIGILPGNDSGDANEYVDIPIPTGLGIARNMIVTNADGVIAIGGGAGTLSEIAFSWQKGRPVAALKIEGWSGELAGKMIDDRFEEEEMVIFEADSPARAVDIIKQFLDADNGS